MGKLILVIGGTRSGKSAFAQNLAESMTSPRYFIATCPRIDPEMDDRIRRHKQARTEGKWLTIEEEIDLGGIFSRIEEAKVCLVDCLTLWVNNLLYREEQSGGILSETILRSCCERFIEQIKLRPWTTICVTSEVGMGIVPESPSARLYRDLVGCCNQIFAQSASEVVLVSCGIPLTLKHEENGQAKSVTFNKERRK